jgi:hypothetical protein
MKNYRELESYFNEKILSTTKDQLLLEEKYKGKCEEISKIESKFDEISERFSFILESIKSHQKELFEDNKKLKDILIYALICYNEKKYDFLNYMINLIKANDTFIDKNVFYQNYAGNNNLKQSRIVEYLYSTENRKNRISDNFCEYSNLKFLANKDFSEKVDRQERSQSMNNNDNETKARSIFDSDCSIEINKSQSRGLMNKVSLYSLVNKRSQNLNFSKERGMKEKFISSSRNNFLAKNNMKIPKEESFRRNYSQTYTKPLNRLKLLKNQNEKSETNKSLQKSEMNLLNCDNPSEIKFLTKLNSRDKLLKKTNSSMNLKTPSSQLIISKELEDLMRKKIDSSIKFEN